MMLLLILVVLVLEVPSQESHLEHHNSKCATSSHKSIVDRDNDHEQLLPQDGIALLTTTTE